MSRKQFEVLNGLPAYGPMHISVTRSTSPFFSEGYVVRFYKTDETSWVANFEPGWTAFKTVVALTGSDYLLVIAYGSCYLMSPDETKPVSTFGVGYEAIVPGSGDRIVLQDQTNLTIVEPDRSYWETNRISWDGLKSVRMEGDTVSGLAYSPVNVVNPWVPFSYSLATRKLAGGSFEQGGD